MASRGSGGSRSSALLRHMDANSMDKAGTAAAGLLLGNTNSHLYEFLTTDNNKKERERKKKKEKEKEKHMKGKKGCSFQS